MANIRYAFFPFSPLDYRAAQAYLNARAREGWRLLSLAAGFAKLERSDAPPRYGIALFKQGSLFDEDKAAFKDFSEDAAQNGWSYVADAGCMRVFCTARRETALLDPQTEAALFSKNFVRPLLWSTLFLLALFILLAVLLTTQAFTLLTGGNTVPLCTYVLLPVCGLFSCIELILAWRRSRFMQADLRAGAPLRTPGEASSRQRGVFQYMLGACLLLCVFCCMALDVYTDRYYIGNTAYFLALMTCSFSAAGFRRMPRRRALPWLGLLLAAVLLFCSIAFRDRYTAVPVSELPQQVLTDARGETAYNRLRVTRNAFCRGYEYAEDSGVVSYFSQSWCYDAASPCIADRLYASACRISAGHVPRVADIPVALPGADRAVRDAAGHYLVLQRGNRVARVLLLDGASVADPAVLERIETHLLQGEI